jgi:peptidoglycan/LPS O-acetylase OafA/YrhL
MKRIEALTFLRFFVALTVITYHFGVEVTGAFGEFSHHFAPRLMSFFFTLSGFVLTISYFDKPEFNVRQFYVARLARVVPLYYIALALTVPFYYGEDIHNLTGLILSATFLQTWVHPYNISFNDPAWSVAVEIFFYSIFPLLVHQIRKYNLTPKTVLFIALGFFFVTQAVMIAFINSAVFQPFPSWTYSLVYFFPLPHLCSFLLGIAAGMIYLRHKDRVMVNTPVSYAVVIAAFLVDYLSIQYADSLSPLLGLDLPTYSSFHTLTQLIVILAIAFTDNGITRFLGWKPFAVLGGASYAIYVLQRPIALALRFALRRLHIFPDTQAEGFLLITITLLAVSLLSFYFIEPAGRKLIFQLDKWGQQVLAKLFPKRIS